MKLVESINKKGDNGYVEKSTYISRSKLYFIDVYYDFSAKEIVGISFRKNLYCRDAVRYLPGVLLQNNGGKFCFLVETISYGSLPVEEIEKVISGYKEAIKVVKEANELLERVNHFK